MHPAQTLFEDVLVNGHGAAVSDLAARLAAAWPSVPDSVRAGDFQVRVHPLLQRHLGAARADSWAAVATAMSEGDWGAAVEATIVINADTMRQRGGAPWARDTGQGVIDVRYPVGAPLLEEVDVLTGWRNPYYLDPLRAVQRDLLDRVQA